MEYNKTINPAPEPAGILLIIGGKEDQGEEVKQKTEEENKEKENENDDPDGSSRSEILKAFIKLTKKEDPLIEVVTTASGEGDEMFETYKEVFEQLKFTYIGHIHHAIREDVMKDERLLGRTNKAHAFFFTGGNQLLLTSYMEEAIF